MPRYETDADLRAEAEIAAVYAASLNGEPVKLLESTYVVDFAITRRQGLLPGRQAVIAFCEVKDRDWDYNRGDGYYLSLFKALKGRAIAKASGLPVDAVVRFRDDTIWKAPIGAYVPNQLILWGRTDRDDPNDIEPCVIYPWAVFELVTF